MAGVIVAVIGGILFFAPRQKVGEPLGIAIVSIGLIGNAAFGILVREIAKEQKVDTLTLTAVPLAFGSVLLIPIALSIEGLPRFSVAGWGIVVGLAVVNTVCAYVLYNHALRVLPAFELSAMLNLSPLVTAIWAWLFLSERLSIAQIIGIVIVVVGVLVVQLCKKNAVSAQQSVSVDSAESPTIMSLYYARAVFHFDHESKPHPRGHQRTPWAPQALQ